MVMFIHTLTEHEHHHDEDNIEYSSMHHHHCYDQEDEVVINFENDLIYELDLLSCLSFVISFDELITVEKVQIPFSRIKMDYGGVPLPDEPYAQSLGFRAPPIVTIA